MSAGERTYRRGSFQNLLTWQKAQDLTDAILDIVDRLPTTRANGVIVTQIVKSCSSIAANIGEGHGRFSTQAYRNHLSIARGSANETVSWLDMLRRRRLMSPDEHHRLSALWDEILSMLSAQMIQLGRLKASRSRPIPRGDREP